MAPANGRPNRSRTRGGSGPAGADRVRIACYGFAAVVAALSCWIVLTPAPPSHKGAAPAKRAPAGRPARGAAGEVPTPGAADGVGVGLTAAPTDVTWQLYDSVAIPSSTSSGPAVVTPSVVGGFAHSPEGALVAMVQISVRHLLAPDWRAVVATDVAPGPGRRAYVANRERVTSSGTMPAVPGHYNQIVGFAFVSYSAGRASIDLVSQATDGAMQVVTETVLWQRGDWRLELQPDGGTAPDATGIASLAGYIAWGGI